MAVDDGAVDVGEHQPASPSRHLVNKGQGVVDRVGREVLADPLPDEERGLADDIAGVG